MPSKLTIAHKGTRAELIGNVSKDINNWLEETFCWAPILELPRLAYFYSDRKMFSGVSYFVKGALESKGYEVDVVHDTNPKLRYNQEGRFVGAYRPRQEAAVQSILANRRGIIHAPPGFGKTLIMATAATLSQKMSLIVVQAKEPFDQCVSAIKQFTNISDIGIGRIGAGETSIGRITVATIQTLNNRIKQKDPLIMRLLQTVEFVAVDECHHSSASSYLSLFEHLENVEFLIGVSATPFRADDKGIMLHVMYGPIIFDINYDEMVEADAACPLKIVVKKAGKSERQSLVPKNKFHARNLYQKIYQEYIVENVSRNMLAVEFAQKLNEAGHTCVIIVGRIEHAYNIQKLLPNAVVVHGSTPKAERAEIIGALRTHRIKNVISTLFDEAVDVSSLGGVALMAGGKSEVKLIQRLRSTRTFDGTLYDGSLYKKKKGFVLYIEDDAPMLTKHSQQNIKELKKLADTMAHIEVVRV